MSIRDHPLRVLHLAAGNRWTGAAAPAFAETEALRMAGVDAHYVYVGGYKLESKIGHLGFTRPAIDKAQNPASFLRSQKAIRRMIAEHQFSIVHSHLTYDHWLAGMAASGGKTRLARTFHARRVLRTDPATRLLMRRTDGVFIINDDFRDARVLAGRAPVFTPPPLDTGQFSREGSNARELYGIPAEAPLFLMIGKLSAARGFEEGLRTFALIREQIQSARLMIIGHGEHRPHLELLAADLGITPLVTWAGYHEEDLAQHYRAADAFLFTARGSDEGHRAILEAMSCGLVPLVFPIEGTRALLGELATQLIAPRPTPESLASVATEIVPRRLPPLRDAAWSLSREFDYRHAARRLIDAYEAMLDR